MFTPRYLCYVLFRIRELRLSQDICIMYYSEYENHVDPQDICIMYYLEFENYVDPKNCRSNY